MNKFAVLDDSDDEERVAKPVAVKEKPVKVKKTAAPAEVAAPAAPPSATNAGNGKSKEKEQNGEKSKSKAPGSNLFALFAYCYQLFLELQTPYRKTPEVI